MEFGILEDYAVRMVLYLAKNPQKIASRAEISEAMDIPMSVLARIGQTLENAGIVEIHRGKRGGYRLRKSPEKITLLDVLESFVGRIALNRCVDNPKICPRDSHCPVNYVWKVVNEKFRDLLKIDFAYILSLEEK
ncbi:MAG: Rrf2 family transcriptional regulator [Caldimicrobium sp.]|nr:Rrf2 family transcriptional regulator [Caldimicrobium sp.]MCX7613993.1 Rrf2 family transcriptional regulator [Caldimicrobium sp.]MDW8182300.1 Rrf2 family transcriptional regulator [Caldimicrobium sp.]